MQNVLTPHSLPSPPLQKGFAGGKVSLRDCFSLFTKEEELELENAPVRGLRRGTVRAGVLVGSTWAQGVA